MPHMPVASHRRHNAQLVLSLPLLAAAIFATGCASPGPPRPPSLHLPDRVTDLRADRIGDTVELRFDTPTRTSDALDLHQPVTATLCRQVDDGPCTPPAAFAAGLPVSGPILWHDTLPPDLLSSPEHILTYKVQLFNPAHRSAGWSDPAVTASGPAPAPVRDFAATGSRSGILLRWTPEPTSAGGPVAEVLLERTKTTPGPASGPQKTHKIAPVLPSKAHHSVPAKPALETQILHADHPSTTDTGGLLDTSAQPDTPYQYTAIRHRRVTLNGTNIDLRSASTPPVNITLHDIYPPPTPTGLLAAAFRNTATGTLTVDLNWEPVSDPDLAGYHVYRSDSSSPTPTKLTPTPTTLPAFHDTTATPNTHVRYQITAIDHHGNESPASAPADVQTEP